MNSIKREQSTRAKAVKLLEKDGWKCWYPVRPGGKFFFPNSRTDIFGLWDILAVPIDTMIGRKRTEFLDAEGNTVTVGMRQIQLKSNFTGEIDEKYRHSQRLAGISNEFWSYDTKKRMWKRVHLDWNKLFFSDYGL